MSKKAIVIYHSVAGNTFLVAQSLAAALATAGISTDLKRVEDANFAKFSAELKTPAEIVKQILATPIITDPTEILAYDYVFMGSPTYFGTVSGAMKCFMDCFSPLLADFKLFGKKFVSFATGSGPTGGADLCLGTLNNFAMHLGMNVLSVPFDLNNISQPAYGFAHFSGGDGQTRPSQDFAKVATDFAAKIVQL